MSTIDFLLFCGLYLLCSGCKTAHTGSTPERIPVPKYGFETYDSVKRGEVTKYEHLLDLLSRASPGEFMSITSVIEYAGKMEDLPPHLQFSYYRLKFEDYFKTRYSWIDFSPRTHANFVVGLEDGREIQFDAEGLSWKGLCTLAPDFLEESSEMLRNENYRVRLLIGSLLQHQIGKDAVSLVKLVGEDTYAKEADRVIALVKSRSRHREEKEKREEK
jgi:hypothetical protein